MQFQIVAVEGSLIAAFTCRHQTSGRLLELGADPVKSGATS